VRIDRLLLIIGLLLGLILRRLLFFIATLSHLNLRLAFMYLLNQIFLETFGSWLLFLGLGAATTPHFWYFESKLNSLK
jgi:hypothetical protein